MPNYYCSKVDVTKVKKNERLVWSGFIKGSLSV